MPKHKYPICSDKNVVKALQKIGYEFVNKKGSHVKLRKFHNSDKHTIVVPLHKELDRGTLGSIISRVKKYYPDDKFIEILEKIS